TRPNTVPFSPSANFPFLISLSRFFPIVSIPRSKNLRSTSRKITRYPARANTCAIPFPIVPAPNTATVLIGSIDKFRSSLSRERLSPARTLECGGSAAAFLGPRMTPYLAKLSKCPQGNKGEGRKLKKIRSRRRRAFNYFPDNLPRQHFLFRRNVDGCFTPLRLGPRGNF